MSNIPRFSLRSIMLGVAVISALICIGVKQVRQSQFAYLEGEIVKGLQGSYVGLANATHVDPTMPPLVVMNSEGKPLYSWRFKVLTNIIGPWKGNRDYKAPWDAPENQDVAAEACYYYCIADRSKTDTNIFAISGPGTAFDPTSKLPTLELVDDVILLMDVSQSGTHWMKPGDYRVDELLKCNGSLRNCVRSIMKDRVYVLFADGDVWCIDGIIPMDRIKPFFTLDGARRYSRDRELGEYRLNRWSGLARPIEEAWPHH